MKYYDVIIVGAGIAGCGLAYNLKRFGYKGSVLVIDKNGVGSGRGYGYRITFEDMIEKYNLPYFHVYDCVNVGAYSESYFRIKYPIYFVDYTEICETLIDKSSVVVSKETALILSKNKLKTDKDIYCFKYLVDCSGSNSFVGNIIKKQRPIIYWINKSRILKNTLGIKDESFYYMFSNTGYFEEMYPLGEKLIHADWLYTKKLDFNLISPHDKSLIRDKTEQPFRDEFKSIVPVSPTLPIVFRNYSFLGDSCGCADPAVGMGIKTILRSSEILAVSLKLDNLKYYEKKWKREFFDRYVRCVASKLDRYFSPSFFKNVKKYPKLTKLVKVMGEKDPDSFLRLLRNENVNVSDEIKSVLPKRHKFFIISIYVFLRLKYMMIDLKFKNK